MGNATHQPAAAKDRAAAGECTLAGWTTRGRGKLPANFLQYFGALGRNAVLRDQPGPAHSSNLHHSGVRETESGLANFRADAKRRET